ncbi:MAG: hypothetical protein K1X26_05210 [Chitinophagales bacterium]|nr:hypothetical protein [Chitinophagales bacterium]
MPYVRGDGRGSITTSAIGPKNVSGYSNGTLSTSLTFPTIGNTYPYNVANINQIPMVSASRVSKGHLTNGNVAYIDSQNYNGLPNFSQTALQASLSQLGYANNIRA